MNKEEYLETISKKTGNTKKEIDLIINEFLINLTDTLIIKGKCSITNLGTFKVVKTKPFTYFSPIDGAKLTTDGIMKVSFTSSKNLLKRISK